MKYSTSLTTCQTFNMPSTTDPITRLSLSLALSHSLSFLDCLLWYVWFLLFICIIATKRRHKTLFTSSLPSMQSNLSCSSAKVLHFRHSAPSSGTGASGCPSSDWEGWGRAWDGPLGWSWQSGWDCTCCHRNQGKISNLIVSSHLFGLLCLSKL